MLLHIRQFVWQICRPCVVGEGIIPIIWSRNIPISVYTWIWTGGTSLLRPGGIVFTLLYTFPYYLAYYFAQILPRPCSGSCRCVCCCLQPQQLPLRLLLLPLPLPELSKFFIQGCRPLDAAEHTLQDAIHDYLVATIIIVVRIPVVGIPTTGIPVKLIVVGIPMVEILGPAAEAGREAPCRDAFHKGRGNGDFQELSRPGIPVICMGIRGLSPLCISRLRSF